MLVAVVVAAAAVTAVKVVVVVEDHLYIMELPLTSLLAAVVAEVVVITHTGAQDMVAAAVATQAIQAVMMKGNTEHQ